MTSRRLDPIKQMIAQAVQHHLVTRPSARPPLLPWPENVIEVEATAISALETQVRVKTRTEGTRYFTIKLSEML